MLRLYKLESFTIINNNYSIMIHNPCDIKNKNKPISEQTPYFMKIEKNISTKKFTNRLRKLKQEKITTTLRKEGIIISRVIIRVKTLKES